MRKQILFFLFIGFIFGGAVGYYFKQSSYNYYYPPAASSVNTRLDSGLSCESIVSSSLLVYKQGENKSIQGDIEKGTDKIAVKLDGDKLSFLTQAAVGAGVTGGDEFRVLQNTNKYLTAIETHDLGGVDSFVLNKETGKAVWSKSRSNYFILNDALNDSFLLNCY